MYKRQLYDLGVFGWYNAGQQSDQYMTTSEVENIPEGKGFYENLKPTEALEGGVYAYTESVKNSDGKIVFLPFEGGNACLLYTSAVDAEGNGVFNGGDEIIEVAVAALVKDLHDDKLCLRRNAEGRHIELLLIRFGQVARDDTGNMCAVAHHSVVIGAEVGLAVGIVEAKRDLAAVINGVKRRGLIQLFGMQGLAVEDGRDVIPVSYTHLTSCCRIRSCHGRPRRSAALSGNRWR